MDAGTITQPVAHPDARLPGELNWWIGAGGRLGVGDAWDRAPEGALASGRVCPNARIGVIERLGARDALLAMLSRGTLDLLCERFPGVRWAIADVASKASA